MAQSTPLSCSLPLVFIKPLEALFQIGPPILTFQKCQHGKKIKKMEVLNTKREGQTHRASAPVINCDGYEGHKALSNTSPN